MSVLPEYIDGCPNISGSEELVIKTMREGQGRPIYEGSRALFKKMKSATANALHMHQPLIPAGGDDLRMAEIISNLKYMKDHPDIGDNHNVGVFHWCYKRMGEFIPQLHGEGKAPRIMLDYSGTILHGFRQMGLHDVIDALKHITCDPQQRQAVEWLGTPWGHAVAPSTAIQDYRLHVLAWQHFFAAIFGMEALSRVRGFSPSEMALPNDPDVAYEFLRTLLDCGFQWVLVQEHSVENPETGHGPEQKHLPHMLQCRNCKGETASIIAIVKTQGSDTKLVAQMQPYYEARGLSRWPLGDREVPPLVTQIADGENGGVMMNEFPEKYKEVVREASGSETPLMNVSEYLECLFASGVKPADLPLLQPLHQKKIWDRYTPDGHRDKLDKIIEAIREEDHQFHMEGGSWTNNLSWVKGYENVLKPMDKVSSLFNEKMLQANIPTSDARFRNALFHMLCSQTSCYRYWGQGLWTDYCREICRRAEEIMNHDL